MFLEKIINLLQNIFLGDRKARLRVLFLIAVILDSQVFRVYFWHEIKAPHKYLSLFGGGLE